MTSRREARFRVRSPQAPQREFQVWFDFCIQAIGKSG